MCNKPMINKQSMVALIPTVFCLFLIACFNGGKVDTERNIIKAVSEDAMKITWQESVNKSDKTFIAGSAESDFGRFNFTWIMNSKGEVQLVTLQFPGSAELQIQEKKVMFLLIEGGVTFLFLDSPSLMNEKKPFTIKMITAVLTEDLFSVISGKKIPPMCTLPQKPESITWSKVLNKNGIKYLQGAIKTSYGSLNLLWKKDGNRNAELIMEERRGGGELPVIERKLLPWIDETSGLTFICQERFPQLNQNYAPYLWCLTAVKTSELLSGYETISETVHVKK